VPDRPALPDVDAVLLDVGGVLRLPSPSHIVEALRRLGHDVDPALVPRAHYAGVAALDTREFAEGDRDVWLAYNRAFAATLGVDGDGLEEAAEILLSEFTVAELWSHVVPGAHGALRALARTGVRIAIVSNADGTVEAQLREDALCQVGPGPGVEVDAILDSAVVGVAKPDPRIFHLALEALGVPAERAIHVGDTPAADVLGAVRAGVRPVLVDPYDDHPHLEVTRVRHVAEVAGLLTSSSGSV
jgi:putative hydrolase of the HAD superfamily